jgi:hypothetical protein
VSCASTFISYSMIMMLMCEFDNTKVQYTHKYLYNVGR